VSNPALQPVLARASTTLDQGRASDTIELLAPLLRSPSSLARDDELGIRVTLAESYLLQGDLAQAATVLGRPPDTLRETLPPVLLSNLWRSHGRVAFARGEQSRAIALHNRALKQAEIAHDSRAIGLAHFYLGQCYRQIGDTAIVREHITEAAAALHAAGDRRHLAMVHSMSGVMLAQSGRYEEGHAALSQAERLASLLRAHDVLAMVYGNQANVALFRHRHEQALTLAERAVALHEELGQGTGLSVALATLGQVCVRLGRLDRAETVLHRALDLRKARKFHETTGAVYDTLAQMSLMRGDYEHAGEYLVQAAEAYGAYGRNTSRWYQWSLRVITARLATRRGQPADALAIADEIAKSPAAPPAEIIEAELIATEALLADGRVSEAERRLDQVEPRLDPRSTPGAWGEYLRLRGDLRARQDRTTEAYHDIAQSASVFELVGERYQAAVSQMALARLAVHAGAKSEAQRHYRFAADVFRSLGAARDLEQARASMDTDALPQTAQHVDSPADADDAIVRRLVNAAVLPDLLARELVAALIKALNADAVVVFANPSSGGLRIISHAGVDAEGARAIARLATRGASNGAGSVIAENIGQEPDGPRTMAIASSSPLAPALLRRARMMAAVSRQGFELCGVRDRPTVKQEANLERPLEPLLPGFVCASASMHRLVEQIQRLRGNDLTVLITGESGTGKELVARAIHVGSPRSDATFLPYNCTTTTRELADSQLFGHRRGSFTGATADQPGLIRTAAGGTLFLDEIGDLPLDVQPKLLRFLEQGEIMPIGETRPQSVDVRVLAATNVDLEQRVAAGKFREDLYYRLSVIRIHVPPLRQRTEEIPHLTTYFLRDASDRLGKSDLSVSSQVLDQFAQYWWPGNVRQLRNEIQRGVAMAPAGGTIGPEHLSADLTAPPLGASTPAASAGRITLRGGQTLASAIDAIERDLIKDTMTRHRGNISESARSLGLTRRGLYLKLRRLGLEGQPEMDTK
jgi:DNA-binding NtrC family response regulator/tetratricopeptide (TPR) repeat protein